MSKLALLSLACTAAILKIDPTTGDRTAEFSAACPWQSTTLSIYASYDQQLPAGFDISADGTFYVSVVYGSYYSADQVPLITGVAAISGGTRAPISIIDVDTSQPQLGTGPFLPQALGGLTFVGGNLAGQLISPNQLIFVDPTTGNRRVISSAEQLAPVGTGPAFGPFAINAKSGGGIYVAGLGIVEIDETTGNRRDLPVVGGPLQQDWATSVYEDPTRPGVLIVVMRWAVLLLEPSTLNSMTLSF